MNRTASATARVYCVDLAKNKFQVHVFSSGGERLQRHTLSRDRFDDYFADPKRVGAQVVMEACASSHHWARRFAQRGYHVKLVPAQFVAKQRMGNKNDGNDADGIYAVHSDPRVRAVPVKTLEQQDLCAQHRLRELLVSQRTQCINQARGLLAERGWVAARGEQGFADLLRRVASQAGGEVTPTLATTIALIATHIGHLDAQLAVIQTQLKAVAKLSPSARDIDSIHGVGCITATAFVAEYGERVERFADARQFAASIGITPREHSSGESRRFGAITKRGNPYLRRLLVQCAQSVVNACHRRDDAISLLARALLERKRRNTVIVAIANRLARIIYAVIKHKQPYRSQPAHARPA